MQSETHPPAGRMIMGDNTFARTYGENVTGDSHFEQGAADDTADSLQPQAQVAAEDLQAVAPSPDREEPLGAGAGNVTGPPDWTAPAFLPPYLHQQPAASAHSDHPALAHSPDVTNSSLNTLETRRVSVDARRASLDPRREGRRLSTAAMQDATGRLLADEYDADQSGLELGGPAATGGGTAPLAQQALQSSRRLSRRRSSGISCEGQLKRLGRWGVRGCGAVCARPGLGRRQPLLSKVEAQQMLALLSPHASACVGSCLPLPSPCCPTPAVMGKDLTENLLQDDHAVAAADGDDMDVLAGLHKQIRIMSQGSPVGGPLLSEEDELAPPQLEAATVAEVGAEEQQHEEEEQLLLEMPVENEAPLVALAEQPPAAMAEQPTKTPRAPTMSLGYADSHNPATMATLRSGGTTQLLRDTIHDRPGLSGGAAAPPPPASAGRGGDTAPTARTNATTKLLADMTMASSIGAKLLGGDLGGEGGGLTDFSLEDFDRPPELPAAAAAGASQPQLAPPQLPQHQLQPEEPEHDRAALAAVGALAEAQQAAFQSPPRALSQQQAMGYPLDAVRGDTGAIPGGPKLVRTPVSVRPASFLPPRTAHGTPASFGRSRSAQPSPSVLRPARSTPASMQLVPAASYPLDVEATADQIPGGPKLARTPLGRTPGTAHRPQLAAPGSAVAQHYPGSTVAQAAYAPGSVLAQRYPGSAVAAHRGGHPLTPVATLLPMTFQVRQGGDVLGAVLLWTFLPQCWHVGVPYRYCRA